MKAPVFIVGASRSGTTMLRLVMNAHSQLGIPPEMSYFIRCARTGQLEAWRAPQLTKDAYRTFIRAFLNGRRVALKGIDLADLEERIVKEGPPDLRRPFRVTMETWIQHQGKTRWGEKTPKHLFFVDVLYAMFPEARFIHLVRDPRGAVYSMNRFPRFTEDSVLNAFNWVQAATVGYGLLERTVPTAQRMTVRFEDLVAAPEQTIRALCGFIDEPFEEDMLQFYEGVEQHVNPAFKHLGGVHTITNPITRSTADKWREGLSSRDIALIEAVCREPMQAFGYAPLEDTLSGQDRLMLASKLAYCRWQWWRNRQARAYVIAFKPFARMRAQQQSNA